jgi:hypothetical protein
VTVVLFWVAFAALLVAGSGGRGRRVRDCGCLVWLGLAIGEIRARGTRALKTGFDYPVSETYIFL